MDKTEMGNIEQILNDAWTSSAEAIRPGEQGTEGRVLSDGEVGNLSLIHI